MIAAVVAIANGGVIGSSNKLPWYLPADLKHFREITAGHTVIMGRKTADSIVAHLGHGLPNRKNIVVTRGEAYEHEGFTTVHSIDDALALSDSPDAFIIGGAQIYELAMPLTDKLYITNIHVDVQGDTYFPTIDKSEWREVARENHTADDKNNYDYDFVELERVR